MSDRTVWVTRDLVCDDLDQGKSLVVTDIPPERWAATLGAWAWPMLGEDDEYLPGTQDDLKLDLYWTLGLPEEPKPGECWKVEWSDDRIPLCTNVTEELRGAVHDEG